MSNWRKRLEVSAATHAEVMRVFLSAEDIDDLIADGWELEHSPQNPNAAMIPLQADHDDDHGGAPRHSADCARDRCGRRITTTPRPRRCGGSAFSQVLTLYATPVFYVYMDRVQVWITRKRRSRESHPPALTAAESHAE